MKKDPMNDDHYDGNDEQIADLKEMVRKLQSRSGSGVYAYLDCSTSHVARETMDALSAPTEESACGVFSLAYDCGTFIPVPDDLGERPDIPADLRHVLAHAKASGCTILRLDADGMVHSDLPVFDWEPAHKPQA